MNYKIITDKSYLKQITSPVLSMEEGEKIGTHLISALKRFGGIGLAANQIGFNKRVCIINPRKNDIPMVLINPKITEVSIEKIIYVEGCLSIPGKNCFTIRHRGIKLSADNLANEFEFKPEKTFSEQDYIQGKHFETEDLGLLESICVQHEVGHLDGKLITDSDIRYIPKVAKKIKIGRNEKVLIQNIKTKETEFIKYKNALELINNGWEII